MLNKREKGLLIYIISHCKRIEEKMVSLTKEEFESNQDIKDIICFNIFQIGELIKNFTPEFLLKHNDIPWKQIKGMRDKIGHGYETVSFEKIWFTANNEIKPLHDYCFQILNEDNQ